MIRVTFLKTCLENLIDEQFHFYFYDPTILFHLKNNGTNGFTPKSFQHFEINCTFDPNQLQFILQVHNFLWRFPVHCTTFCHFNDLFKHLLIPEKKEIFPSNPTSKTKKNQCHIVVLLIPFSNKVKKICYKTCSCI